MNSLNNFKEIKREGYGSKGKDGITKAEGILNGEKVVFEVRAENKVKDFLISCEYKGSRFSMAVNENFGTMLERYSENYKGTELERHGHIEKALRDVLDIADKKKVNNFTDFSRVFVDNINKFTGQNEELYEYETKRKINGKNIVVKIEDVTNRKDENERYNKDIEISVGDKKFGIKYMNVEKGARMTDSVINYLEKNIEKVNDKVMEKAMNEAYTAHMGNVKYNDTGDFEKWIKERNVDLTKDFKRMECYGRKELGKGSYHNILAKDRMANVSQPLELGHTGEGKAYKYKYKTPQNETIYVLERENTRIKKNEVFFFKGEFNQESAKEYLKQWDLKMETDRKKNNDKKAAKKKSI